MQDNGGRNAAIFLHFRRMNGGRRCVRLSDGYAAGANGFGHDVSSLEGGD